MPKYNESYHLKISFSPIPGRELFTLIANDVIQENFRVIIISKLSATRFKLSDSI